MKGQHTKKETNALYFSVKVFSTKVLIGDTIFKSPIGDGTDRHFTWPSEPREGQPLAKAIPSFLSYFKILGIGPVPGIEPAIFRYFRKFESRCNRNDPPPLPYRLS